MLNFEKLCYAKTQTMPNGDNVPSSDVFTHSCVTGLVSEELSKRVNNADDELLQLSILLSYIHDVGKISPGFQQKLFPLLQLLPEQIRESVDKMILYETNHAEISDSAFQSWSWEAVHGPQSKKRPLREKVILNKNLSRLGAVLGTHHGYSSQPRISIESSAEGKDFAFDVYGGKVWDSARKRMISNILNFSALNVPKILDTLSRRKLSKAESHFLAGRICFSDWISSGIELSLSVFSEVSFLKQIETIKLSISRELDSRKICKPEIKPNLSFSKIFSSTKKPMIPRVLQEEVFSNIQAPGVYILEAPMGVGKTEAALYSAYQQLQSGVSSGVYFGLPTRLSSSLVHDRVIDFHEAVFKNTVEIPTPRLAHGTAWLENVDGEFAPGRSWFSPAKRALLTPTGVGTIDQALLGAISVKHSFIRSSGLAKKVVVFDEIHSYDVYTSKIIQNYLLSLVELKCTVILLSATLSIQTKRQLFSKFNIIDYENWMPLKQYPLLTSLTSGAESHLELAQVPLSDSDIKSSSVRLRTTSSESKIVSELISRASSGQRVVWISSTVKLAQERYRKLFCNTSENIAVDLLHSKFIFSDRRKIEDAWSAQIGPSTATEERSETNGSILITTQVIEQSVDFDFDFMVSDIAPTDLILQRLGRVWRHDRKRPSSCCQPEILVNIPNRKATTLSKQYKPHSSIYSPYILHRSAEVLRKLSIISLPCDIRELVEDTYTERVEVIKAVREAKETDQKRNSHAEGLASAATHEAFPTRSDENENVLLTRHSEGSSISLILCSEILQTQEAISVVFYSGERFVMPRTRKLEVSEKARFLKLVAQNSISTLRDSKSPIIENADSFKFDDFNDLLREAELFVLYNSQSGVITDSSKKINSGYSYLISSTALKLGLVRDF